MRIYKKALLPVYFKASGVASGVKKNGKPDLGLFYSHLPAKAACLFTTNKIQAAPIRINKSRLKKNKDYRLVIVNSGNANCFTGSRGVKDAEALVSEVSRVMKISKEKILAASTGIIGRPLPVFKIKKAIPALVRGLSEEGIEKAKKAIMTTDTFDKEITVSFDVNGREISICGVAKGAGMIAPDMATMLCFILTDADIAQDALDKALKSSADNSFNCITVDGCMSTNDTVILLANGAAGNDPIRPGANKHFADFAGALNLVCLELAKMIVKDAEGATKFIRIRVSGAGNFTEAKKAALAIANSSLFKTAVYGRNPNFGRIVQAVGASGVDVKEEELKIKVSPLNRKNVDICVSVGTGKSGAVIYTSDLTPEYIRINAEYT